jgi:hypothetical protein
VYLLLSQYISAAMLQRRLSAQALNIRFLGVYDVSI